MAAQSVIHGRYTIRSGTLGNSYTARAFVTGAKPGGAFLEETAATEADALDRLRNRLNERDAVRRKDRRLAKGLPIPTKEEFHQALGAIPVTKGQRAMLTAHMESGSAGLTAGQLARAAGYAGFESANLHYGNLGSSIAQYLDIALTVPSGDARAFASTSVLADWSLDTPDGIGVGIGIWIIHPELLAALREGA